MRLEVNINKVGKMDHIKMVKRRYYPTPLNIDEKKSFLKFPEKKVAVLYPCCGSR